MEVLDGHDEDYGLTDLINDTVWESACPAPAAARRKQCPRIRELHDSTKGAADFRRKLKPKPLSLRIVIVNGVEQFSVGGLEKLHRQGRMPSTRTKTSLAEMEATRPAS